MGFDVGSRRDGRSTIVRAIVEKYEGLRLAKLAAAREQAAEYVLNVESCRPFADEGLIVWVE